MCHFNEIDVEKADFKAEKTEETENGVNTPDAESSRKPNREELDSPKMEEESEEEELLTT